MRIACGAESGDQSPLLSDCSVSPGLHFQPFVLFWARPQVLSVKHFRSIRIAVVPPAGNPARLLRLE